MKICFKCGREFPATDFHRHKGMADGRLNKCKYCVRAAVAKWQAENPERDKARKDAYAKTEAGKAAVHRAYLRKRVSQEQAMWARAEMGKAIASKKLIPQPCFICGADRAEGHHSTYSLPLDVTWLCKKHHVETHRLARQLRHQKASNTNH